MQVFLHIWDILSCKHTHQNQLYGPYMGPTGTKHSNQDSGI